MLERLFRLEANGTRIGREIAGEGVVGFSYPLLEAGARVVAADLPGRTHVAGVEEAEEALKQKTGLWPAIKAFFMGGGKSLVSWRITPIDTRACTLRITVCPHALQDIPVAIRWIPYTLRLRPLLRDYRRDCYGQNSGTSRP